MNPRPPIPAGVAAIDMQAVGVGALRDPATIVLEDVNWQVRSGEYWVVAGLQGSGKTDFLLMTGGLTAPAKGNYLLFGQPMPIFDDARLSERLRLGVVFENGQLFNHLTVSENVALPLRYHHNLTKAEASSAVQQVLEILGLQPWADSTPGAISRNWQKRTGLARALILRPEILLIDNPLAGLDLPHLSWWMDFLNHLSKGHELLDQRPLTLVVTTADLRPWKNQRRSLALVREKQFTALGDWAQTAATAGPLVAELLMKEPVPD